MMAKFDDIRALTAHDINILGNSDDRSKRVAAIKRLIANTNIDMTDDVCACWWRVFECVYSPVIVNAINDSSEKCRELVCQLLSRLMSALLSHQCNEEHNMGSMRSLFACVHKRLLAEIESSEEIRLQLVVLMNVLLANPSVIEVEHIPMCVDMIKCMIDDSFPDVKRATCTTVSSVCQWFRLRSHTPPKCEWIVTILQALLSSVRHQHSRIRVATLAAVADVIGVATFYNGGVGNEPRRWEEDAYTLLSAVVGDASASVRELLYACAYQWLTTSVAASTGGDSLMNTRLLLILIGGITDDQRHDECIQQLHHLAHIHFGDTEAKSAAPLLPPSSSSLAADNAMDDTLSLEDLMGIDDDGTDMTTANAGGGNNDDDGDTVLLSRFLATYLSPLLSLCFHQMTHFVAAMRLRAAKLLHSLIEHTIVADDTNVRSVVNTVLKRVDDEDIDVSRKVLQCAETLAMKAPESLYLPLLWDTVFEGIDDKRGANGLVVVVAMLRGMRIESLLMNADNIIECVARPQLCTHAATVIRLHAYTACNTLCDRLSAYPALVMKLVWPLHQIEAVSLSYAMLAKSVVSVKLGTEVRTAVKSEDNVARACGETIVRIAMCNSVSVEQLYEQQFTALLDRIIGDGDTAAADTISWNEDTVERHLFVRLLEVSCATSTIAEHFPRIAPALIRATESKGSVSVRMDGIRMLHMLASESISAMTPQWRQWVVPILRDVIEPNAVWRGGKAEAAVRNQAVLCMEKLLSRRLIDANTFAQRASTLLPVLQASVDDDSANTRLSVCRCLFHGVEQRLLPADAVCAPPAALFMEVHGRLDDSEDSVRIAACHTMVCMLGQYFDAATARGSLDTETILKNTLIHLDDVSEGVQRAATEVCTALRPPLMDESVYNRIVTAAKDRSRNNPQLCSALLLTTVSE